MDIPESGSTMQTITENMTAKTSDPLVSDAVLIIFQYICYSSVGQIINVFGVVTNIINIICFIKQGFKDIVNISLFGLAISGLGCLVTSLWLNLCLTPAFQHADLPFEPIHTQYITASFPHQCFSRISGYITAFITLERCLCITVPLKVKLIFTPKRVTSIIVSGVVLCILNIAPMYFVNIYTKVFFPDRNRTIMAIMRTADHRQIEQISIATNISAQSVIYFVVIFCTARLICKLQSKTKWRQSFGSGSSDSMLSRDQNVTYMVLIISMAFILSLVPNIIISLWMAVDNELGTEGKYKNTLVLMFGCHVLLESINSAMNIFVYYKMSTRYRSTFRRIFGLQVPGQ